MMLVEEDKQQLGDLSSVTLPDLMDIVMADKINSVEVSIRQNVTINNLKKKQLI